MLSASPTHENGTTMSLSYRAGVLSKPQQSSISLWAFMEEGTGYIILCDELRRRLTVI